MNYRILLTAVVAFAVIIGCNSEKFGGFGIEVPVGSDVVSDDNPYKIVRVFENGTGDRAGLKEGDIILSVDEKPLKGKKQFEIVQGVLRGKVGTSATFQIKRGDQILMFRIPRGSITLQE